MDAWSLASGSSGNAYLLTSGETAVLVDCGLPLRRLEQSLKPLGLSSQRLSAVFLTHAHGDHLGFAPELTARFGVPVYATAGTLSHPALREAANARAVVPGVPAPVGEMEVLAFRVPHDCVEPVGYRFRSPGGEVCLVTDLGYVPGELLPWLSEVRLLVVEANHDLQMLQNGPYPASLKRRVLGRLGHLSNAATAAAIIRCPCPPEEVWLAHLSRVNNTPTLARRTVARRLARAGLGHIQVRVAARNRLSLHWSSDPPPVQLPLW